MTTYYATPAAANYYSPPSHAHRQRGVRVCDTCGSIEQPTIKPFRLCGGCVRHRLPFAFRDLNSMFPDVIADDHKLLRELYPFPRHRTRQTDE